MAVSESFKVFMMDQLSGVEELIIKKMFGGCGLYGNGFFFGILDDDRVYFKTNEVTRKKYQKMKMKAFQVSEKQILKNYFEVPTDVIEDSEKMKAWALEAILVSQEGPKK